MVLVVLVACKGGEESGSENIGCLPGAESAYLKLDIQGAEPGTVELDYQELHACSGWYDSETFLLTWADPSTYVVDVKVGETIPGPAAQSSTMAYLTLWESGEYWHSAVEGGGDFDCALTVEGLEETAVEDFPLIRVDLDDCPLTRVNVEDGEMLTVSVEGVGAAMPGE